MKGHEKKKGLVEGISLIASYQKYKKKIEQIKSEYFYLQSKWSLYHFSQIVGSYLNKENDHLTITKAFAFYILSLSFRKPPTFHLLIEYSQTYKDPHVKVQISQKRYYMWQCFGKIFYLLTKRNNIRMSKFPAYWIFMDPSSINSSLSPKNKISYFTIHFTSEVYFVTPNILLSQVQPANSCCKRSENQDCPTGNVM